MRLSRKEQLHYFLSTVLAVLFIITPLYTLIPTRANAITVTVNGGTGTVPDIITAKNTTVSAAANTATAKSTGSIALKELKMDGVFNALAKMVVQGMVRSTVAWINSGFKGSPMFVTDPGQFLLNIADQEAGRMLYNSEDLNFLCRPMNIRIALDFYYRSSRNQLPVQCTLSGALGNVQRFMEGNFLAAGWPGWLSVSLNPTNHPIGGAFAMERKLETNIAALQNLNIMEWGWARGFLSTKSCDDGPNGKINCRTITPGDTIASALNYNLTLPAESLISADEINEVVGALFAQLAQQALTGAAGVFGLTDSGSGSSGFSDAGFGGTNGGLGTAACNGLSYLNQLSDPRCNLNLGSGSIATSTDDDFIGKAIHDEQAYQRMHQNIIDAANDTIAEATERGKECSGNTSVIRTASRYVETASSSMLTSKVTEAKLAALAIRDAQGTVEERIAALSAFNELSISGGLHSSITNVTTSFETADVIKNIQELRATITDCPRDNSNNSNSGSSGGRD